MTIQHIAIQDGYVHAPQNWTYADAAARNAAVITDSSLIGRLAYQTDNGIYYRLMSVSPAVWSAVNGQGNLTGPISSSGLTTSITSQTGTGTTFVTSVSPQITGNSTTIEGLRIGLGGGAISSNTVLGIGALASNSSGIANMAVGTSALTANTDGLANSAGGFRSLWKNTSGSSNTGYGYGTLNEAVSASNNTAFGATALILATGGSNTGVGSAALANLTSGSNNTTLGYNSGSDALLNITTQSNQVVVGNNSTTDATIKVAWTVISDERDKHIIGGIPHGLDFVLDIAKKTVSYKFKEDRKDEIAPEYAAIRYGWKSQDILALEGNNPVIVNNSDPEKLGFNESYMVPILYKAIAEMHDAFTARICTLEAAILQKSVN